MRLAKFAQAAEELGGFRPGLTLFLQTHAITFKSNSEAQVAKEILSKEYPSGSFRTVDNMIQLTNPER